MPGSHICSQPWNRISTSPWTSAPPAKSRSRELNNYEPDTRSVGFQVLRTEFEPRQMNENELNTQSPLDVRQVVERIAGAVEWISEQEGFATCQGEALHTHRGGKRDCKVYLDKVPTLTCFHASCEAAVKAKNAELRQALADPAKLKAGTKRRLTPEEMQRLAEVRRREGIRRRAAGSRERILREFRWPVADIVQDSPDKVLGEAADHWRPLLELFQPGDFIWAGDIYDSGQAHHARSFRSREEWLTAPSAPGSFTCPTTFRPGSYARSNGNVAARRFLVVESDTLSKDEVGAVFRWLKERCGLRLRAVVDTGGKSLHGWFDFPQDDELADLRLVLPELECDPKLFTASQPVRLPGTFRQEKQAYQRLLFLDRQGGAR